MTRGLKLGRMKACLHCGKEFYCQRCRDVDGPFPERKFCDKKCDTAYKQRDPDSYLWARINKNGPNGCWVYSGATDRRGYGRPGRMASPGKRQRYYAHRRSYEIHKGPIPEGMLVLHSCDNPPCCNPDHLSLGKDADNHVDMRARGRANYISRAKLAEDQVREIRASQGTKEELAAKYSVSPGTIYNIKTRRIWKNI